MLLALRARPGAALVQSPVAVGRGRPIYLSAMQCILAEITALESLPWFWQALLRLVLAGVLGAAIGVEREHRGRSAGLRTMLLVALGSALAMVVSVHFANVYGSDPRTAIRVDPARVAYGVMTGIGFLGAGAIIRYGTSIRGLTTAAGLWCTAAIGLACGFGMFLIAVAATFLVVFTLFGLHRMDRLIPSRSVKIISVTVPVSDSDNVTTLHALLKGQGGRIHDTQHTRDLQAKTETIQCEVSLPERIGPPELMQLAGEVPGVLRISIT